MTKAAKKATALLVLAALWFSALSPAMASVLFADRPDVLARMLALPAQSPGFDRTDICHHDASTAASETNPYSQTSDDSEHANHGVFCSFCLIASSVVMLLPVAQTVTTIDPNDFELPLFGLVPPPVARLFSTHRSRAPPFFF